MIGESPMRPGYFQAQPLVLTPARDVALPVDGDEVHRARDALRIGRQFDPLQQGRVIGKRRQLAGRGAGRQALAPDRANFISQHLLPSFRADLAGEALRASAGQQDMRQLALHNLARDRDGEGKAAHQRDRARIQRPAVHDAGVQLELAQDIGVAVEADGVLSRVGLYCADADLDGIHSAGAILERAHGVANADGAVMAGDDEHPKISRLSLLGQPNHASTRQRRFAPLDKFCA